jgi:superfamily II DNA or RNA helicase
VGLMRLWPFQVQAVSAAVAELASGGRAQVVMACGTGKTNVAAEVSRRVAPAGRVLTVVSSLELLTQTAGAVRALLGEGAGRLVAVCSEAGATTSAHEGHAEFGHLRAPVTTDPAAIAAAVAGGGRVSVLSTYHSLPALMSAHRDHGLPPWDLMVLDEAHRTAGAPGKAWAVVHDNHVLPAARRLYLTATPRIAVVEDQDVVSMDDPAVFGREVYRLSFAQAIELGRLADYRVLVSVVTDAEVAELVASTDLAVSAQGRAVPPRMLAAQIALAKAIREYDLRRVITYHARVLSAKRFAGTLPDAVGLLSPVARPRRSLDARSVDGAMRSADRRRVLAGLRDPSGVAVVSNCRVFTEGVDVPELDAVMFADPRDSTTDIVQAVGRALRRGQAASKTATIILPVPATTENATENASQNPAGSGWDVVWRVVGALRAHDERVAHDLDSRRIRLSRPANPNAVPTDLPGWLRLAGIPVDGGFAAAVSVRMVHMTTSPWLEGVAALEQYRAETGTVDVRSVHRTEDGFALGEWLRHQRAMYRRGLLPTDRQEWLDKLGVDWDPDETAWWQAYRRAKSYHAEHGDLNVPAAYRCADGFRLGGWLTSQRTLWRARIAAQGQPNWSGQGRRGLTKERIAALDSLGMVWDWSALQWQTWLNRLDQFRDANDGNPEVPAQHVTADGARLGGWLQAQRDLYRRGNLHPDRRRDLEQRGVVWAPREMAWRNGLAHLRAFRDKYGHCRVRADHVDPDGYLLGRWVVHQRHGRRQGRLTEERIAALDTLGMVWQPSGR